MKKFTKLLFAAAAFSLLSGPSFAQASADDTLTLSGTMVPVCTLSASPVASSLVGATTFNGTNTVSISDLFSTVNATMAAGGVTLTYAGMCNYNHFISLRSTNSGLSNVTLAADDPVAGSGTFVQKIGFAASAAWAGAGPATLNFVNILATPAADAPLTSTNVAVTGSNQGDLVLTLTFPASAGRPVVRGAYADTLFVQIGADI